MTSEKVILCLAKIDENYRLDAYGDFFKTLKTVHPATYIPTYSEQDSADSLIDNELSGRSPDIIFIFNAEFAPTDFTKFDSKIVVFTSDSMTTNKIHGLNLQKHKMSVDIFLHNYLYKTEDAYKYLDIKSMVHFPCWASEIYDAKNTDIPKEFDFLLSGSISGEYSHRMFFRKVLRKSKLEYIDKLGNVSNSAEDNAKFFDLLLKSKYSLLDGGINGRVMSRYFESSYAKSVVISPDLGIELRKSGFIHGENCILIDRKWSIKKVREFLWNVGSNYDWENIAEKAYNHIKRNHTTTVRVRQFLEIVL